MGSTGAGDCRLNHLTESVRREKRVTGTIRGHRKTGLGGVFTQIRPLAELGTGIQFRGEACGVDGTPTSILEFECLKFLLRQRTVLSATAT